MPGQREVQELVLGFRAKHTAGDALVEARASHTIEVVPAAVVRPQRLFRVAAPDGVDDAFAHGVRFFPYMR